MSTAWRERDAAVPTSSYQGSRADVRQLLSRLLRALSGVEADPWGVTQAVQLRMGVVLLSLIQQAFIVKSRGGTDDCGIRWPPLKRETIARRRLGKGEAKRLGITGPRTRGLLTPAEDARWRKIFARKTAQLQLRGMSLADAKARAAQIAWTVLKQEGAKTKLDVLGSRTVDMLRDTGELLRSLTPGVERDGSAATVDGQILRAAPGKVIVGTNKKPWHHNSGRRLYWPTDGNLPASWWEAILGAGRRGVASAVGQILGGAA